MQDPVAQSLALSMACKAELLELTEVFISFLRHDVHRFSTEKHRFSIEKHRTEMLLLGNLFQLERCVEK